MRFSHDLCASFSGHHLTADPLDSTHASIREDYLSGQSSLRPFYNYPIQDPDFAKIIADKSTAHIDRTLLQRVIREQYGDMPMCSLSQQHLEWLGQPNSFTITTGHQVVLLGGPLFTTYKVLSTAKLAERLNQQFPDQRFVPIFWIHTEDHDFEEVNHYYQGFGQKQTYSGSFTSQVGNHIIEDAIQEVLPAHPLSQAYQVGGQWKDGFRTLAFQLFDKYGVLILDADHPDLKAVFRPILKAELLDSQAKTSIDAQSLRLTASRYKQQINPREINLFYMDENGRDRIDRDGEDFVILNRNESVSRTSLLQWVEDHPERFSPNVCLRPLYQEMILPNLAYFGGWGELSYWLQLKEMFEKAQVNFPLLLPRFSATAFTQAQWDAWHALGFDASDIRKPLHSLYQQYLPNIWNPSELIRQQQNLLAQIDGMTRYVEAEISPTLARTSIALRVTIQKRLERLQKKAGKVMRNRFPKKFQEIELLKLAIQPDGQVQERVFSLFAFDSYEPESFLEQVWGVIDPLKFDHAYLVLDVH